jgi:2-amino-4-hydroxy-6-hydroxymethyldihydropteridine diphosphokinase
MLDAATGISVIARSSVYETEPVGEVTEQRDFCNAVVEIRTELSPHDLLDACKRVERDLGRSAGGPRHGPRTIDVDLLVYGDVVQVDEQLVLPHPELAKRRFVLAPLVEIAPELTLQDGRTVHEALVGLGRSQRVDRVGMLAG